MKFASPQAALEWCLENRAALVYEPFAHTKTLFSTAPGTSGILVKSDDFGRQRQRVKRFHDAFAALAWCVAKNSAFLYFPQAGNPADN